MSLSATEVRSVFMSCLFKSGEIVDGKPPPGFIEAEGLRLRVGLHPGRVEESREKIRALLDELPSEFHQDGGGGMSFLNMCMDKSGGQWGEHQNMDELVCLGLATGMLSYCMPREFWSSLPGGVPYIVVNTKEGKNEPVSV